MYVTIKNATLYYKMLHFFRYLYYYTYHKNLYMDFFHLHLIYKTSKASFIKSILRRLKRIAHIFLIIPRISFPPGIIE